MKLRVKSYDNKRLLLPLSAMWLADMLICRNFYSLFRWVNNNKLLIFLSKSKISEKRTCIWAGFASKRIKSMAKNNFFRHCALVPFLFLILQLSACDAAVEDDTDPTGATPSVTEAKAIGPTNQLVAQDTLNVANEISANTAIALQAVFNFEDPDRTDFEDFDFDTGFQASVNPASINDIYSFETFSGTVAIEDLAEELTSDGAGSTEWPGTDCTSSGVCNCTIDGTRTYTGTLNITVGSESPSGSISGDYTITYTGCIELLQLDLDDGPCTMAVQLDGTIEQSVSVTFSNFTEAETSSDVVSYTDLDILQTTSNQSPISFINDTFPSSTPTAVDTVDFAFEYAFTDSTAIVEPDGFITHTAVDYNMVVLQEFIESSTNAEVCP